MGPWVAAASFLKKIASNKIKSIQIHLYGSLAKTGKGHGTDIAVILGLSGFNIETIDVEKINDYITEIKTTQRLLLNGKDAIPFNPTTDIEFIYKNHPKHPNALTFSATLDSNKTIEETFYSIGGGFILQDGFVEPEPEFTIPYPIQNEKDISSYIEKSGLSIAEIVLKNELTWKNEKLIQSDLNHLWQVMLKCMFRGSHTTGTLPGGLFVKRRAAGINNDLLHGHISKDINEWIARIKLTKPSFSNVIKWVSCFALAVNEENGFF